MPAQTDFLMQVEKGVLGSRDSNLARGTNATKPLTRTRATGATNSFRPAFGNENIDPNVAGTGTGTNGRRSPRLGSCAGVNSSRPLASKLRQGAQGNPFSDITNVANVRASELDKFKAVKQPRPLSARTAAPTAAPAAAPAAPAAAEIAVPASVCEAPVAAAVAVAAEKCGSGSWGLEREDEVPNAQSVREYVPDIVDQFFRDEAKFLPRADYMASQTDLTPKMRTILIDWLIEVHMKYRLRPETLHLTMNLIDRYLSKAIVMRKRLQLIGVVAMFVAAKFEEINPPELHDWVYICDKAYTKEDILRMECTMLSTLGFHISVPTAAHFFDGLQKANGCGDVHRNVAQYLLELGLLEVRLLQYSPSHIVSAALLLSNELLSPASPAWPALMEKQSRHDAQALRRCADELRTLLDADRAGSGGQLQAVHKKFSTAQHHAVAKMKF